MLRELYLLHLKQREREGEGEKEGEDDDEDGEEKDKTAQKNSRPQNLKEQAALALIIFKTPL